MFRPTAIVLAILLTISISATTWSQAVENPYEAVPQSRTDDGAFVLGNRDAKMRFIEFSDFLCGHCQNYESVVETFIQQFVLTGQAQIEYRMFPVVDPVLSPQSAALAECADTLSPAFFGWRTIYFSKSLPKKDSLKRRPRRSPKGSALTIRNSSNVLPRRRSIEPINFMGWNWTFRAHHRYSSNTVIVRQ